VVGGHLSYSKCDSGVLAEDDTFNATLQPNNNSLYMIMGSYVEHGVASMISGTRIVIVFFYKVNTEFDQVLLLWNNKQEQCRSCLHCFVNKKTLGAHAAVCKREVTYSRFKKAIGDDSGEQQVIEALTVKNSSDGDRVMKLCYFKNKQCYFCKKFFITKRSLINHRKSARSSI
jgi:hypothetical protein